MTVEGLTAPQIGDLAARDGLRVHELTPITASLEDAFMELTQDEVEYRPSTMPGARCRREKRSDDDDRDPPDRSRRGTTASSTWPSPRSPRS